MKRIAAILALVSLAVLGIVAPANAALPGQASRLAGADRYATAAKISQQYPSGAPVAYVATGTAFADALSAAPAAALQGGPLLLTQPSALPAVVRDELRRLAPQKIVVVGGTGAISSSVYRELAAIQPDIRRDAGSNRYETSRIVNERAFRDGAQATYVATGRDFPDALSASAAAGSTGGAVVLVDGKASTVDAATKELITSLGATQIRIAGGTGAVSAGIASQLEALAPVVRLAGANRYETSVAISRHAFPAADEISFAVGTGFADALAGAALSGHRRAPLLVTPAKCLPAAASELVNSWGPAKRWLFGGTAVLGTGVQYGTVCTTGAPFGNGDHRVGSNVTPGTYFSANAANAGCYWEALSSFDGEFDSIIANDFGSGQRIATIARSDYGFSSSGCGTWRPIQDAPRLGTSIPGEGVYVVGQQIAPGTYRSTVPAAGGCYWATLSGLEGFAEEVIASDFVSDAGSRVLVELGADVTGFVSSGCGQWSRMG